MLFNTMKKADAFVQGAGSKKISVMFDTPRGRQYRSIPASKENIAMIEKIHGKPRGGIYRGKKYKMWSSAY